MQLFQFCSLIIASTKLSNLSQHGFFWVSVTTEVLLTFLKSLVSWLSTESVNLSFGLSFQISFFLVLTPMMSGCSSIWTLSKQTPGQVYQKGSKIIFWMFMVIQNQIILVWLLTSWKQVIPETDICKVSLKWCLDLSMNWLFFTNESTLCSRKNITFILRWI